MTWCAPLRWPDTYVQSNIGLLSNSAWGYSQKFLNMRHLPKLQAGIDMCAAYVPTIMNMDDLFCCNTPLGQ